MTRSRLIDVDFSLAMHNRTGKYFIGQDLLGAPGLPIGRVYYWIVPARAIPTGLAKKVLGRLQLWQVKARTVHRALAWLPARTPDRPLLHLDPFTVPTTTLRRQDIVLCHDVGPVTHPALFAPGIGAIYASIYDHVAKIGPHLVFVSSATEAAFMALHPAARPASTRVIYNALRERIGGGAVEPIDGLDHPFLLTVGSIGDRKNQARCIVAYRRSGLWRRGIGYVLCGARDSGFERVAAVAAETPGVTILPYVSDAELSWLYGAARGFVLASLLEGFGMPVSEAIARGLVPLVSRDSVLHEVAGDGAIMADPTSEAEIADGMRALAALSDAERQARLELLTASNGRFALAAIQQQWREAFADFAAFS